MSEISKRSAKEGRTTGVLDTLAKIMNDDEAPPTARVAAASAILDRDAVRTARLNFLNGS